MGKIGVNEKCPCGSGRKYKKCCREKNEIKDNVNKECDLVVEKILDEFEKEDMRFRETSMENFMKKNIKSIYLQCKYLKEKLDENIILDKGGFDKKRQDLIRRKVELLMKLLYLHIHEIGDEKPKFVCGEKKEEFTPEEYLDIIVDLFASLFEYYQGLLKEKTLFDIDLMVKKLNEQELNSVKGEIRKMDNLKMLYEKLCERTKKVYFTEGITPFYLKEAYELRCACFHMDYFYKVENSGGFFVSMNKDSTKKIFFSDLLSMGFDVCAKINVLMLIPHLICNNRI